MCYGISAELCGVCVDSGGEHVDSSLAASAGSSAIPIH